MKKFILMFCFVSFSNYLFSSSCPHDYLHLRTQLNSQALKDKVPFYSELFDVLAAKLHENMKTLDINLFRLPQDLKNDKKAKVRRSLYISESIKSFYVGLFKILQTVILMSYESSVKNQENLKSFDEFRNFLQRHGTSQELCDCMHQAIQEITPEEMLQLLQQTYEPGSLTLNCAPLNHQIALNFRKNVVAAAVEAEKREKLQEAENLKNKELLQVEEILARDALEAMALDMPKIKSEIEQKIIQQDFKNQQAKDRSALLQEFQFMRAIIDDEQLKNRLNILKNSDENVRLVLEHEEQSQRSVFFKRFSSQVVLKLVRCNNQQHAKMVEVKRKNRIFHSLLTEEQQERFMIAFQQSRDQLQQQNDFERGKIDQESFCSFRDVIFALPVFQALQSNITQLVAYRDRNNVEIDETIERLSLKIHEKNLRAMVPRVVSTRRHDPYAVAALPEDYGDGEFPNQVPEPVGVASMRVHNPYARNPCGPALCFWCGQLDCEHESFR